MKKIFQVILTIAMTAGLAACGSSAGEAASASAAAGIYTPGTFTGISHHGKGGDVSVDVTFSSDAITEVKVGDNSETAGISDPAIEQIPEEIVNQQSLAVDTVSGATITSNAILEAVADAVTQAGGDAESLKNKAVETEKSTAVVEKTADVVIAGAGAAGMSAATAAIENGADSVIIVEKEGAEGGNAIVSGGFIENTDESLRPESNAGYDNYVKEFFANGPQNDSEKNYWDTLEKEYKEYQESGTTKIFDSTEFFGIDTARTYGLDDATEQVKFADLVQQFDEWLQNDCGAVWNNPTAGIVGFNWPRWASLKGYYSGSGYFAYIDQWIKKNNANIELLTSTPMTDLIQDENGKITGLVATGKDGTTYRITAEKGVILATGGYAANIDMVRDTDGIWGDLPEDMLSTNASGDTGEGIQIAEKYGASVGGMENTMLFPLADIKTGSTEAIVGNSASLMLVNKEGNRFVDETLDRYTMSGAELAQTDQIAFAISCESNSQIVDGKTQGGTDVANMLKNGELYKADTIEELAVQAGINAENLKATIEAYNKACADYNDPLTGRTSFEPGSEITDGPYYAYPVKPAAHITDGGINTTSDGKVTDENGNPIEGLYAAGEITNGNSGIDGSFAYGRYVGANVASGKDTYSD